jgi:hypothetical protein
MIPNFVRSSHSVPKVEVAVGDDEQAKRTTYQTSWRTYVMRLPLFRLILCTQILRISWIIAQEWNSGWLSCSYRRPGQSADVLVLGANGHIPLYSDVTSSTSICSSIPWRYNSSVLFQLLHVYLLVGLLLLLSLLVYLDIPI